MIDQENVEKFAQDQSVPFTNYASLTRAKAVQDLIWSEIEKVNANFARVEAIKKFYLIEQQLTPEDEELTPDHETETRVREPEVRKRDREHVPRSRGGVGRGAMRPSLWLGASKIGSSERRGE